MLDRGSLAGPRAWLRKWAARYPKLCDWVESNIEETLTFYREPHQHHKNLKSTNLLERLDEEIKIGRWWCGSPNRAASAADPGLSVEMGEKWIEATRYLNMEYLKEHKKEVMRQAA